MLDGHDVHAVLVPLAELVDHMREQVAGIIAMRFVTQRVAALALHLAQLIDEHREAHVIHGTSGNLILAKALQLISEMPACYAVH